MKNDTNSSAPRHFLVYTQSSIDGRKLYIGEGSTKSSAWEDAHGRPTARKGWGIQETSYDEAMNCIHGYQG